VRSVGCLEGGELVWLVDVEDSQAVLPIRVHLPRGMVHMGFGFRDAGFGIRDEVRDSGLGIRDLVPAKLEKRDVDRVVRHFGVHRGACDGAFRSEPHAVPAGGHGDVVDDVVVPRHDPEPRGCLVCVEKVHGGERFDREIPLQSVVRLHAVLDEERVSEDVVHKVVHNPQEVHPCGLGVRDWEPGVRD